MIKKLTCIALICFSIMVFVMLTVFDYMSKNIIGGKDIYSLLMSIKKTAVSAAGIFVMIVCISSILVLKLSKKKKNNYEENYDDDIFRQR
ncbi:MAG: hypothetical protein IJ696_03330 [Ruminococcus sp.]|nr:hypothetical protein [Ruminococcus sp.]